MKLLNPERSAAKELRQMLSRRIVKRVGCGSRHPPIISRALGALGIGCLVASPEMA